MPTPREAFVNTVEAAPVSTARVRAADYGAAGEMIGRAVQGFGQEVQKVSNDLDDIRTIYATAAAKDADAQAALRLQSISNGYRQLQQGDAIAGKDKALADIDALEAEMTGQVKDGRARKMFEEVFQRRKLAAIGGIQDHEMGEVVKYGDARSEARESASKIVAIDAPTEDEMFVNIETAISEKWSRMRGAATEDKALAAYELRSEVLAKRAQTIQDPIAAEQFRAKHAAMISPEHELTLIRSNKAGLEDAQAAFRANDFASWRAGGKKDAPLTPGSPITHEPAEIVPSEPAPRVAAAPRSTAVVKGATYDPTRGIGKISQTVAQHRARGGGTGRTAIDIAAPVGTAIYPPVRGKVVEADTSSGNGNFIRVDYGDGLVGTYLHMKTPSPLKAGDVVETSNVIGLVGNTGKSHGAHVDYSVKRNDVVADPTKVAYRGYGGEGTASTLDQYKPEDADTTTLVADIREYARAAGLSQVEERRLLRDQMEVVNFNRGLQQDKERIADRAADEWLIAIGDRPFKLSEVPGFSQLSPASKNNFIQAQDIRSRPKEPEAGGQSYIDAMVTMENDPETFRTLNLDAMPLTREERSRLKIKQGTLSTRDGEPNKSAIQQHNVIYDRINTYLKTADPAVSGVRGNIDKPEEIRAREEAFAFVTQQIVRLEAEKKRPATYTEIDTIVQHAMVTAHYTKDGKQQTALRYKALGSVEPTGYITTAKRDRARFELRRVNGGVPPTEAQIDDFLKTSGL